MRYTRGSADWLPRPKRLFVREQPPVPGGAPEPWNNNQTENALWSINQDRNSWFGAVGVGWEKVVQTALTALAAHAYQPQHVTTVACEEQA